MFEPQKVLITRTNVDAQHEQLQRAAGLMMSEPHVGQSLHMFVESGRKMMRTSPVTHVAQDGDELVIDTRNSHYRLRPTS